MTPLLLLFLVAGAPGAPQAPGAGRAGFELLILAPSLRLPGDKEAALAKLRSAPSGRPLFVVHAADVETYIWKTQRITLTREASARLAAALDAAARKRGLELQGSEEDPARELRDRIFQVRLGGEFLYGGLFDPWGSLGENHPVIKAEWVEGRAIFYLLPMKLGALGGELEEGIGASRYFVRHIHPPPPYDDDADRAERRAVLRDARVQALFAGQGKLVPEPPPPRTPAEIRLALEQTDLEVHECFARGNSSIEPVLDDRYVLHRTNGYWSRSDNPIDKRKVLDAMAAGLWRLPFYVVLAAEPPLLDGERSATVRSLIAMRGNAGSGAEIERIVASTRRYRFDPPAWLLAEETQEECADDSPGVWRPPPHPPVLYDPRTGLPSLSPAPCWPPATTGGKSDAAPPP